MVNKKFGRLIVIEQADARNGKKYWSCVCECGTFKDICGTHLRLKKIVSCGCYQKEIARVYQTKHGHNRRGKRSRAYRSWCHMLQRCNNLRDKDYKYYGGRGITVCKRWAKFENFLEDMGEPPGGLTLDRINNDGNYCKGNCRWATSLEQSRNRRPYARKNKTL